MSEISFRRIDFSNFKAFQRYSLKIEDMNILVGPNNSGKSTILNAFRVLAVALRRANARRGERIVVNGEEVMGYEVSTEDIPMSLENIHTDYDKNEDSTARFTLSNGESGHSHSLGQTHAAILMRSDLGRG